MITGEVEGKWRSLTEDSLASTRFSILVISRDTNFKSAPSTNVPSLLRTGTNFFNPYTSESNLFPSSSEVQAIFRYVLVYKPSVKLLPSQESQPEHPTLQRRGSEQIRMIILITYAPWTPITLTAQVTHHLQGKASRVGTQPKSTFSSLKPLLPGSGDEISQSTYPLPLPT